MPGSHEGRTIRVLLVEDDADHAELVRRALSSTPSPVELTVCADAETALARLGGSPVADLPHLILLDLRLPGMSGLQLLKELKSAPAVAGIPRAVLTTSRAEPDMARATEFEARRYLVKPVDAPGLADLLAEVERHWASRPRGGAD